MEQSVSTSGAGMRFGLFGGIALIVFDLLLYVLGVKDPAGNNPVQYLSFLILIGAIVMAIKHFKDNNDGLLSLGQGVGAGTIAAIIAGIIVAIYIVLFFNVIDPGFLDEVREAAKTQAMENNDLSEEQFESMEGMINMFTSPTAMAITSVITYAIVGLIISLIAGLIMRNKHAA